MNKTKLFLALSTALTITACGGGGGGGTSGGGSVTETTDIKAIDGYLGSAYVYADKDTDGVADDDEFQGKTDENGVFPLDNNMLEYPLIVKAVAGETTDSDKITPITKSFELTAPAGSQFVTPFTTLAHQENKTSDEMDSFVAELNLDSSAAGDYIAAKETNDDAKKVHAIARSLTMKIAKNGIIVDDITLINQKIDDMVNKGADINKISINENDEIIYTPTDNLPSYVANMGYGITSIGESPLIYDIDNAYGVIFNEDGYKWHYHKYDGNNNPIIYDNVPYSSDKKGWKTERGTERVLFMQQTVSVSNNWINYGEFDFSHVNWSHPILYTLNLDTNDIYFYNGNYEPPTGCGDSGIDIKTLNSEFYLLTNTGTPTLSSFEINNDNTLRVSIQKSNESEVFFDGTWINEKDRCDNDKSRLIYNGQERNIQTLTFWGDLDLIVTVNGEIFSENKDLITSIYNQWVANMK